MHDVIETVEKMKEVKELKEKLLACVKDEIAAKGLECVDTEEAGKVVDMIKDLAEVEKCCAEALYYSKVTEAMVSYEEPRYGESADRYGYDHYRYKSSGRYAPKGHGTYSATGSMGFRPHIPYLNYDERMEPSDYMHEAMIGPMGYSYSGSGRTAPSSAGRTSSRGGSGMDSGSQSYGYYDEDMDPKYGRAYNEYKMKRRHYTESRSKEDKMEMEARAEEHVQDSIDTIRDIWEDADPTLKKRMKENFGKLLSEMNA